MKWITLMLFSAALGISPDLDAQENPPVGGPVDLVFKVTGSDSLRLTIFPPAQNHPEEPDAAMVIFHGGGWTMGDPSWAFGYAKRYAQKGMVAVAAQYRLSNQRSITPIDAMEDARDAIIWLRKNARELGIAPDRIVAFGWSAGAHLAACAAVFPSSDLATNISSIPDALILYSPALSVENDAWFHQLLPDRSNPEDLSPARHVREQMPPAIIVIGRDDTVTPLNGSEMFHQNMVKFGNQCQLVVYDGVGHLFTPSDQPDNGWPNPDEKVREKALKEIDLFLKDIGFMQ
jgi:acetyl esterase/lipase